MIVLSILEIVFAMMVLSATAPNDPSNRSLGVCLIIVGALLMMFSGALGRSAIKQSRSLPANIVKVWDFFGVEGLQRLYLGLGIVLAIAGLVELVRLLIVR
jgi:hypothetical protein